MPLQFTVPSKTFLLGEYAVLKGGPALILCTAPRFKLIVTPAKHPVKNSYEDIHENSPAGKLIASDLSFYQQYHLNFIDPYHGLGGFGASSAQFAMLAALKKQTDNFSDNDLLETLELYRQFSWAGKGIAPSGADVIAQLKGNICFSHRGKNKIASLSWPFTDIEFCLVHTENKLQTHLHLAEISDTFNTQVFEEIVHTALHSLEEKNSLKFAKAINDYYEALASKNLVANQTNQLLQPIRQQPGILAAKGCGALGADTIFVLLKKEAIKHFSEWANQHLHMIYIGHDTSPGIEMTQA